MLSYSWIQLNLDLLLELDFDRLSPNSRKQTCAQKKLFLNKLSYEHEAHCIEIVQCTLYTLHSEPDFTKSVDSIIAL